MSDIEARIAEVLAEHQPSRWRSFTNENEILRCCGQDFGNLAKKAKRDDDAKTWAAFTAHQAALLAPVIAAQVAEEAHATITAYVEAWPGFRTGWGHDPESIGARAIANKTVAWLRARWIEAAP